MALFPELNSKDFVCTGAAVALNFSRSGYKLIFMASGWKTPQTDSPATFPRCAPLLNRIFI
jgi:hypothetical protein